MTGTESAATNPGGFDLLRRATQAMMSRYVTQVRISLVSSLLFLLSSYLPTASAAYLDFPTQPRHARRLHRCPKLVSDVPFSSMPFFVVLFPEP